VRDGASARAIADSPCANRKVDVRLPGKGNSKSHDARPVHLVITMIKWIQTSRLSIKNSLSDKGPRWVWRDGASAPAIEDSPCANSTLSMIRI